ncbi:hypothetical protein [Leptospira yasudae]|uniref:Uncharacterized protein n=1 Tax=Leptospira yasudae TaxID=2202201 RepID=A0A6N4QX12_9LEPT|nr:hypothetical protein [Leptospira yasudae]TGL75991.1 hypothetical protein EHQ72_14495 [Leptospira yasudae]TGL79737.1 hypothetical protein EHQ83_17855 [Leptospira yasudae]TGL80107.1 hypothetical protein EHQ77_09010 [Leptospira yasudae]
MTLKSKNQFIEESSASVQAHLSILQSVIERMAMNSSSCKAWCITIVSAVLVIVADKGKPEFSYIAFIPTLLFLFLDGYYLALEKGFRTSYNNFVQKLHSKKLNVSDLYTVLPEGNQSLHQVEALKSFSVWGFYIVLGILILVTKTIVIS